ncbi:MAG: 2-oxo-tetronate isomerase [Burkholderiales bacterium]
MLRFAANLTLQFAEVDFLDRFAAAANAGFTEVEYRFPYSHPKDRLAEQLHKHKFVQVQHNMPAGDWGKGERGIALFPSRVGEFQDSVGKALEYAVALDCKLLHCMAGISPEGVPADRSRAVYISNLQYAARELKRTGSKLLIEPINTRDLPGYFLCHTRQALDIIAEVGSDNVFVQYDIHNMQIMEGDLSMTIRNNLKLIAHMQVADTPGRHEPGTGEINYPFLFEFIDGIGYQGWLGCEYTPLTTTAAGLAWIEPYLHR